MDQGLSGQVGVGPGSICTTRIVAGVGVPQITAIAMVAEVLKGRIPLVADGGIRYSGDIAKARVAGASSVMNRDCSPVPRKGPAKSSCSRALVQELPRHGFARGDGAGLQGSLLPGRLRCGQLVPEGIEGLVPYRGPLANIVHQLSGRSRVHGYVVARQSRKCGHRPKFVRVPTAGTRESHVHEVADHQGTTDYRAS